MKESEEDLRKAFMVSEVALKEGKDEAFVEVDERPLCPRCRNHVDELADEAGEEAVCPRCHSALKEEKIG